MINFFKKTKKTPENIKDVLSLLNNLGEETKRISRELKEFKEGSKRSLCKVGLVRFNPFKESGGDQSFSVAVLDSNNNGFVITSYYSRESNRIYAKPVGNGSSSYSLSKEETEAIAKATKE